MLEGFKGKRGEEFYWRTLLEQVWIKHIRPQLSVQQTASLTAAADTLYRLLTKRRIMAPFRVLMLERLAFVVSPNPVTYRNNLFEQMTYGVRQCVFKEQDLAVPARELAQRQQVFNRLGGEMTMKYGLSGTYYLQDEINQSPLRAAIQPGLLRMRLLPKGMILLGEPGNGKTYFARTLVSASRLPLVVTESDRFLDESAGLFRLKTLFRRARRSAPNIVYIRDLDFMTRDRERYDTFASVRITTHLLLCIDGYTTGCEPNASKRDIFIIGSLETTATMDAAMMRSGRLEWLVQFDYPLVTERRDMFALHGTSTLVNKGLNVDWDYFSTMSRGFTCLDVRMVVNTSAVHVLQHHSMVHTKESVVFGLGAANHVHDAAKSTFVSMERKGFFPAIDFRLRNEPLAEHAAFFTQTGYTPIYKKLMHLFRLIGSTETTNLPMYWNSPSPTLGVQTADEWDGSVSSGLVAFFCEGLLVYNLSKAYGPPYSRVTFDSYCAAQSFGLKEDLDEISEERTLEGLTKELVFLSTFSRWHRSHSQEWTSGFIETVKPLMFRTSETTTWRARRLQQRWSVIRGLTEMEKNTLFGPAPMSEIIHNRLTFLAEKGTEVSSVDPNLFGLFETRYELATMRKKVRTTRRTRTLVRELSELMEKPWRHV
jgi:hypothetical protein